MHYIGYGVSEKLIMEDTGGMKKTKDRHYSFFTIEHLINHLSAVGFYVNKVKFIDDKNDNVLIKLFNNFIRLTPFWRSAYKRILIEGIK